MEGSGAQSAPPPAPMTPAPKGMTMMYALVAIVVAIVVVVSVAAVVLMNPGSGNGGGATWDPQQGQYLEYTVSVNGTAFATVRLTVTSFTATTITLNFSTTVGGHTTYQTSTVPKTEVAGSGIDVNNPPSGYTVVNQGKSSVTTSWGARLCDHIHVTNSTGMTMTMDMYLYKDLLVRMEAGTIGTTTVWMLTGTNISLITSG